MDRTSATYVAQALGLFVTVVTFQLRLNPLIWGHAAAATVIMPYYVAATLEWTSRPKDERDRLRRSHTINTSILAALTAITIIVAYSTMAHTNALVHLLLYVTDALMALAFVELVTLYLY
jgi:hypothetical protein